MTARPGKAGISVLAVLGCLAGAALSPVRSEPRSQSEGQAPSAAQESEATTTPVPFGTDSIERGKVLYARHCAECHGPQGKALMDVIADATDLTSPKLWYNGTERDDVFSSIKDGAGVSMPPYAAQFDDEELWDLTNFTQSLWPEAKRPPLQDE